MFFKEVAVINQNNWITEIIKFKLIYPQFAEFTILSLLSSFITYYKHLEGCLQRDKTRYNTYKFPLTDIYYRKFDYNV